MYNPGAFPIATSVLGLEPGDIMCWPLKSGVSVSYSPLALLELNCTNFQRQTLWELIFSVQILRVGGAQYGAWFPRFSGRTFYAFDIPSTCGSLCQGCASWLCFCPSDHSQLGFSLFYNWGRAALLVFRSFSEWVTLHVAVSLVCPWEEVSSRPSYSTTPLFLTMKYFLNWGMTYEN